MISLPAPNEPEICLRKVEGGIAAISKFSGKPTEDIVREKEISLRSDLVRDGLKTKSGCLLARYNDPGSTWSFTMVRNKSRITIFKATLNKELGFICSSFLLCFGAPPPLVLRDDHSNEAWLEQISCTNRNMKED